MSPLHINRENARWWIVLGGVTAALIASDQKISDTLPQTTASTSPSRWTSRVGRRLFAVIRFGAPSISLVKPATTRERSTPAESNRSSHRYSDRRQHHENLQCEIGCFTGQDRNERVYCGRFQMARDVVVKKIVDRSSRGARTSIVVSVFLGNVVPKFS
jgi:hypothetical protein